MNTWVIALSTYGEAIRKRIGLYIVFASLVLIILSQLFASLATQGSLASGSADASRVELQVIKSMAFGIIVLGGLVLAVFLSFDLIPSDIDKKTIYTILAKPVPRWQYVVGKFLGVAMALGTMIGFMGIGLFVLVWAKSGRAEWPILPGVLLLWLAFAVLSATSIMFSLFLSRNVNVALTIAVYIMGTVSEFWQSIARTTDNPGVNWLAKGMHYFIPNLYNFNLTNALVHPEKWNEVPHPWTDVTLTIVYGLLWIVGLMAVSVATFNRKEL
jgi:ABC-type transport system involved in multi-copper enzyme maturation permease subunit